MYRHKSEMIGVNCIATFIVRLPPKGLGERLTIIGNIKRCMVSGLLPYSNLAFRGLACYVRIGDPVAKTKHQEFSYFQSRGRAALVVIPGLPLPVDLWK
jgi:hypothetical protein